ncbi:MAG: DNRLRE domain-containing protein [Melioribacteraceae bacterium]|nr:DNRLRE domain-containing protein [Melioribacteraceae bacterium]
MNRLIILLTISILLLFSINSCSDDPTSLGVDLIPDQDLITINSIDSAFFQKVRYYDTDTLALNSSSRVLLGKSDRVESTILMKFLMFFPDSIKKPILADSVIIKSAIIEMEPIYTFGEESNTSFDFTLHKITNTWNSLEFGKKDLPSLEYNLEDVSTNRQFHGDSLITMDVDKNLILDWMKLSANKLQEDNYGLYFKFTNETNKVVGFPAISTLYDSVLTRIEIIIEVPSKFTDTLIVQVTSDAHVVLGELPTSNNQNIFVQGGIPVRSNMFFDVSSIPNYAIINRAILKLSYDESETLMGNNSLDFLSIILVNDFETSEIDTDFPKVNLVKDSVETFYSGDISQFVQNWVTVENNGFQLYLIDEISTVNKLAIATEKHPNQDLRPYLEIIYTSKK